MAILDCGCGAVTIAPRVLVLAPLAEERSFLLSACGERHSTEIVKDLKLPCCYVPDWRMALPRGGHGKAEFALQAQYLILRFPSVTLIACVGAAGGLNTDVSIGDVVVGTETIEHDYRLLFVASRCRVSVPMSDA
jgi:adenosylhomocysteine nucleosidase